MTQRRPLQHNIKRSFFSLRRGTNYTPKEWSFTVVSVDTKQLFSNFENCHFFQSPRRAGVLSIIDLGFFAVWCIGLPFLCVWVSVKEKACPLIAHAQVSRVQVFQLLAQYSWYSSSSSNLHLCALKTYFFLLLPPLRTSRIVSYKNRQDRPINTVWPLEFNISQIPIFVLIKIVNNFLNFKSIAKKTLRKWKHVTIFKDWFCLK